MKKTCLPFWALIACGWHSALGADVNVQTRVEEVCRTALTTNEVDQGRIEQQLLGLLDNDTSSEQKGTVYAAIAKAYNADPVHHSDKLVYYAHEAMKNKLGISDTCEMYLCLGNAEKAMTKKRETQDIEDLKKQSLPFIQGLSFVLDRLLADKRQPLPAVGRYDMDPHNSRYAEVVRRHEMQMAIRDGIAQQNRLLVYRDTFCQRVLRIYSFPQINDSPLIHIIREAITNSDKAEKVLLTLKSEIEKQKAEHPER